MPPVIKPFETQARDALADIRRMTSDFYKSNRQRMSQRFPLEMELQIVVLYGMYRGWANKHLTKQMGFKNIGSGERLINKRRKQFEEDPNLIFRLPLLHYGIQRGKQRVFTCAVCRAMMPISEIKAKDHVFDHFFPAEYKALAHERMREGY